MVGTGGICPELENISSANSMHLQLQKRKGEKKQNRNTVLVKPDKSGLGEKASLQAL